jgi:Helix-turn-helix domain
MILTFRYRLLPARRQHRVLEAILEGQRELYNAALQERIEAYRKAEISRAFWRVTFVTHHGRRSSRWSGTKLRRLVRC